MTRGWLWGGLLLGSGCVLDDEPALFEVSDAAMDTAPEPGARRSVVLAVSAFVHTDPMTVTIAGLNPAETAHVAWSGTTGLGPCPPAAGGVCLSLGSAKLFGSTVADASGTATLSLTLPSTAEGRHVVLQALVVRGIGGVDSVVSTLAEGDIVGPGVDADGDGFDTSTDCDDTDPSVNPDAVEICDDQDNDCDPLTSEDGLVSANGVNYPTLPDAVFSAAFGATVDVCAGTFPGDVVLDHDVSLRGRGSGLSIVQGSGVDSVIEVLVDGVTVEGLTVTGGSTVSDGGVRVVGVEGITLDDLRLEGNALYLWQSEAVIRDVSVHDSPNHGAYLYSSALDIENFATDGAAYDGIWLLANDPVSCTDCEVRGAGDRALNVTLGNGDVTWTGGTLEGSSGGVYVQGTGTLGMTGTTIVGNMGLGGVYVTDSGTVELTDVTLHANLSDACGGGVYIDEGTAILTNVDFGLGATANLPDDVDGSGFASPIGYFVGPTTATCTETGC